MKRTLALVFGLLIVTAPSSRAADPASGTLTDTSGPLSYTAGPLAPPNPTPVLFVDSGPECLNPAQPCDDYVLTLSLPAGYAAAHPNAAVKLTLGWTDAGAGASDYDLYVYRGIVTDTDGSQGANYQSAGSANPEVATISPLTDGTTTFTVKVVPYTPTGETVNVRIELLPGPAGGGNGSAFGGPDPTAPGVPRYQNFFPPAGTSAESSDGEFNIGFNPRSRRILTMNFGPIWRVTPAEVANPASPESCPAVWDDKSALTTNTGLDPILFTDQKTGRTFASNSTAGANAVYAYSDDDGDTWIEVGAAPPDGSDDHETIGSGPYPAALSALGSPLNQGEAVYYCGQTFPVGAAACQRSDTLGSTYGPGVLVYDGITSTCGGLHGHVHVAPNGTVWLPVNQCGGAQGGAVSTDAGTSWREFVVTGSRSQVNGADPSIALDADSTAYYCYVNNEPVAAGSPPEGHVHVKVSRDGGLTWTNDVDLGASHGIKNAAHTEAVGGSSGRAACGFIGTNVAGDYQSSGFPGVWYAFIATTYDGGLHWVTVNATPNDPVQRASGIWQQGGSHQQRNLLDFNEVTVDHKGRVLYGYSDGCVSPGCVAGTAANDFTAHMRVARQFGGKSLFAANDTAEPTAPKPACLSGTRDAAASHLKWMTPDDGGSAILGYQVFRGTAPGNEVLIGQTPNAKTTFEDTTADPAVATYTYFVKAVNAAGTGGASNSISLTVVLPPPAENVCELPGLTKLTDASGDTSAILGIVTTPAPPGSDLHAFHISQPYEADGVVKLAFTIDTDAGQSPQLAGSSWYVAMKIADPAPATTFHYRAVHMTWNGTTPTFESYTPGPNNSGGVDGRFVTAGSTIPADPSSSYAAPFDTIVIVVKASDLGLAPGDTIAGFVAGVSQTEPGVGVATTLYDQMPDSLTFSGSYTVRENRLCRPDFPPVAILQATPNVGCAPLTVTLDASQSYDPDDDALTSYRFDFGDGSAPLTQASAFATHTYAAGGAYSATLQVSDERSLTSTNLAQAQVSATTPPSTPVITAPASAKAGQTGLVASVASHAGSTYSWSIQDGTITAGQGTNKITFKAGSKGQLTLSVREISQGGCVSGTATATVTVTKR